MLFTHIQPLLHLSCCDVNSPSVVVIFLRVPCFLLGSFADSRGQLCLEAVKEGQRLPKKISRY